MTAAGGVVLVVREFRRRDRKASMKAIEDCADEVSALREDMLNYRGWAYSLSLMLTGQGIHYPPAPPPVHVRSSSDRPGDSGTHPADQGTGASADE